MARPGAIAPAIHSGLGVAMVLAAAVIPSLEDQKPALCRHVHVNISRAIFPGKASRCYPRGLAVLARTINSTGRTTSAAGARSRIIPISNCIVSRPSCAKFCRTVVRGGL